jgi:hypothetical protein
MLLYSLVLINHFNFFWMNFGIKEINKSTIIYIEAWRSS